MTALTLLFPSLLAAGLLLILLGVSPEQRRGAGGRHHGGGVPAAPRLEAPRRRATGRRVADYLAQADLEGTPLRSLVAACVALGGAAGLLVAAVSGALWVAVAIGLLAAQTPLLALQARRRRRLRALQAAWPDAIDQLVAGVRAGLSVGEALAGLADRGPAVLRAPMVRFARAYRTTGRLDAALERLVEELADPTGDQVVACLRIAREVGGTEIAATLQTLAAFLRDQQRLRLELEARQTWVVTAARVALVMPWLVLLLLLSRPEAVAAYQTTTGALVVGGGALAATVGYRLMLLIGRLPEEPRVLHAGAPGRPRSRWPWGRR